MGLRFLVLDKKKKYTSVIGDILDITGHGLLVALNEEKAKELIKTVPVDILLLDYEDMPFWLSILEEGYYVFPIFFLERYEDGERLISAGFTELNFVVLPFNPIDLLSNALTLSKGLTQASSPQELGFTNMLLHVLRRNLSARASVNKDDTQCMVYVKKGVLEGLSCPTESLKDILNKRDVSIQLLPHEEERMLVTFRNVKELLLELMEGVEEKVEPEKLPISFEEKAVLEDFVSLADGVFWMSSPAKEDILQINTILRVYKKEDITVPILINAGSSTDLGDVVSKIEKLIGGVEHLKGVVVFGTKLDDYTNAYNLLRSNPRLSVITTIPIAEELFRLGVPMSRMRLIESFPQFRLRLSTGDVLRFIPIPFCPEKGSFMMHEEGTGILYTGDVLSSYGNPEVYSPLNPPNLEDLLLYQAMNIPDGERMKSVIQKLSELEVKTVIPKYGNVIWNVEEVKSALMGVEVGFDLIKKNRELSLEDVKELVSKCREWLSEEEFFSFVQAMSTYAYIDDELREVYIELESLPSVMLSTFMVLGIRPTAKLNLLRFMHRKGLISFPV